MDTSASPEDPPHREEEPMDLDTHPKPQPKASTPLSQNSPGFILEKSLSVPSQPEFSHDVFISTPSFETGKSSQGTQSSKRNLPPQNQSPKHKSLEEQLKRSSNSSFSQPRDAIEGFQLELSENSCFAQKTQSFIQEEDSQATQIEENKGTVITDHNKPNVKLHSQDESKKSVDREPPKADSQSLSTVTGSNGSSVLASQVASESLRVTPNPTSLHSSVGAECVPHSLNELQSSKSSAASSDRTATPLPASHPSQSVLCASSQKNIEKVQEQVKQSHSRLHSHTAESVRSSEEEEQMDEGEVQSTVKDAGMNLLLSQSQVASPEPMEEEKEGKSLKDGSSSKEGSFNVIVLEESQRASQENLKVGKSPSFRSSSQPVGGSLQERHEALAKTSGSQPGGSAEERYKCRSTQPRDSGLHKANSEITANKSLSDSSGELPFHFTLPKDGELIRPAATATPPQISLLKKTPRHSTPIEMTSFSEPSEGDVTRETTMPASEILVEESRECEEPDGKLSLRMKLVTPVEEGSSEHFSLQKPSLTDEEESVSKTTTVSMAVTSSSVFNRVREAHRQVEIEGDAVARDPPLRQPSQLWSPSSTNDSALSPNRPKPTEDSRSSVSGVLEVSSEAVVRDLSSPVRGQHALSASNKPRTPVRQRAVSQQTSVDISSTTIPPSKKAVSQQTSFDLSEPLHQPARGEPSTPTRTQPGPSLHRHVRTIQEVRTTVTRIITDVYYEDGREESEEPVVDRCVLDNDISPSRTGSSMTSGDLGDVSSLSSKAASHHSSSGASSSGLGPIRIPDFLMPLSRGAKFGRSRGRQQPWTQSRMVGAKVTDTRGCWVNTQLSPRGRARRGRPPSRSPLSRGGKTGQRGGSHAQGVSSSEEEHFIQKKVQAPLSPVDPSATSHSDSLTSSSPNISTGSSSFVGLRVLAKWSSNSYFYSGSITRDLGESRFRLLFDDNQECEVQGKDILLCDPIPLETEVTALTQEEYFNIGVVKGHKTQGSEFLYCVEKEGQIMWYSRTSVILSLEQGNRLREQYGLGPYEPSTPQTMAADISLDNLVEGKRRRRGNSSGAVTPTRISSNSPRNPGPSGKRKLISGTEEERTPPKRGRRGGGARVERRIAACNTSGSGVELPPDPNDLVATHGPLPENASLFMGFVFMLTASSESDREFSQQTSDQEEEDVERAPYNKHYTMRQLEAGGGMILLDFNEEQCQAAYQSLLIADQHCRTRKYLLCVAGGTPCVSQMWVRDCCQEGKLLNYRNYLLPAGLGPEGHLVEW
ncbi:hypothetical protein DNTS_018017 [Danionella cerebrum]|nr:hypothetical protein DNTS_018017 [Danionella translucida]